MKNKIQRFLKNPFGVKKMKLTKGNITAIIVALISGLCTVIGASIGLGVPVVAQIFESRDEIQAISTEESSQESTSNLARMDQISIDSFGCVAPRFAVPKSVSIPPSVEGNDPYERFNNTYDYLYNTGVPVAAQAINMNGVSSDDVRNWASVCDPSLNLSNVLWNNTSTRILVKEVTLIIEAYDYEPSRIPSGYKLVLLIPPQFGGPGVGPTSAPATPIPYQQFNSELKATSNSLPFLSMSKTPPILVEPNTPMDFFIYLYPISTGTFRMHLSFYVEDSQGNKVTLNSESIVSKWLSVDNLNASQIIPIDVR